ncbi:MULTISPECIES: DUF4013 domain-containing protein [Haloarcula]|uniref:DUF4013 domain-containing protein n=1 Tax=Haloarcula pellucida TaxID=1427151 RepID=A0A830GKB9_9EURY|nr:MULTISPECIES: DUF4013 domain-containing protein [Halomicroarcula]MBX0347668.1 DUF4013 domain-containing protein [Halomicroarcula pellucida]MDS0276398.1 DUF4013 domain-containing protein [Halomicroarcula sp. S1AR25-4]GGN89807.1 hypothetical protein GCM10009030_10940 [Halomicroarcula pellucida]
MFQEALNYPRNSDSAVKNIAIGGLLLFVSFLVVPTFLVLGYVVRTLRQVLGGVEEPPEFDDWGEMLVDGLKAFAIGFVYALLPTVIAIVALFATGVTAGIGGSNGGTGLAIGLIAVVTALLVAAVSLLVAYVIPAAVVAWVRTDRLGAAFSPAELRPMAFSRTYATGWLVAVGIGLLSGIVIGLLNVVVIGAILAPFITFYANVAGAHAIGSAVREMPAVEEGPDAPASQPAA